LEDLEQAASTYHADGVPVAIEGLEILKDWIYATDPLSPYIALLEDLISTNKTMPENPERTIFDHWSSSVRKVLIKLRGLDK
jgi:hypothetical protein